MLTNSTSIAVSSTSLWQECLEYLQSKIGPSSFDTWFRTTELSISPGKKIELFVPNQFFADFIEEHFNDLIKETLNKHSVAVEKIFYTPLVKDWKIFESISDSIVKIKQNALPVVSSNNKTSFFSNYTFESFIVGDNNQMAHAAALAVAEAPGKTSFNPLIIYGGTGLGKTHLLQAIGHFAQTETTAEAIAYLTSEEFTNQYIDFVINKKDSTSFYKKFSDVDLLLIDDIHFFSGKHATQKEFFRIFNRLLRENKQIVLTSDRLPEKIPDMMEHLLNRFLGGLTADIQLPNLETRMAILRKKAENDGINLPDEVAGFLAANITSNVRELEGILIKLIASSSFTGRDISLDVAREICGDLINRKEEKISIHWIQEKVAESFNISPNQLTAHTRKHEIILPRSIAMYLCKKWTKQSMRTIGFEFGGRDYSTVIYCHKKIETELSKNEEIRKKVESLERVIQAFV